MTGQPADDNSHDTERMTDMSEEMQVAKSPEQLASEIKVIEAQTRKMVLMAAVEIGERLTQAKATLPAGCWTNWLKENVDYSERKAQVLMSVYRNYGDDSQMKLFGGTISDEKMDKLGFSQAVALLAIKDDDERAEFINENPVEDMSVSELEQAIKEKNELKEAKEKLEAELEKARRDVSETESRLAELESSARNDEADNLRTELEKQKEAVRRAKERAINLQDTIMKESREKAELVGKVNELEKELAKEQAKPIEAAVVYEVPEETKKELAELREELEKAKNRPAASEDKVRFVMYFEALNKAFEGMLKVVNDIEDEGKKQQYRDKLLNIVDAMKASV